MFIDLDDRQTYRTGTAALAHPPAGDGTRPDNLVGAARDASGAADSAGSGPGAATAAMPAGKQQRAFLPGFRSLYAVVGWLVRRAALLDQVRQERRELARLSDRSLADLGINTATAEHESRRGYFDLPKSRKTDSA